jgi:hypothetical protein
VSAKRSKKSPRVFERPSHGRQDLPRVMTMTDEEIMRTSRPLYQTHMNCVLRSHMQRSAAMNTQPSKQKRAR